MPLRGAALQALGVVAVASGFICFGYDQSIANTLLQSKDFQATFSSMFADTRIVGAVLGAFVLGCGLGCVMNCFISQYFGRKIILIIATIVTLLGTGLQAGSVNLGMLIAARIINGIGVGFVTSISPTYIGELASARIRGRLMSMELVLGSIGLMTGFCMSYAYRPGHIDGPRSWREPLAWQAPFILVTLVCCLFLPESPRYLASKGKIDEARDVLVRLHGVEQGERELLEIQEAIALEARAGSKGWSALIKKDDQCLRYRFYLAVMVNVLQQLTGINMATYYAGVIIGTLNFSPYNASILIIMLGLVGHFGAVIGCLALIDRIGRRWLLMGGSAGLALGQAMLAGGIAHVDGQAGAAVAAAGLFWYIFVFSGTWLPGGFLYGPEVTPLSIRLRASCIGYCVQFLLNFAVVEVTPYAIAAITWKFYLIFTIINALSVPIVYFTFPETCNLSLEMIDALFLNGKPHIRKSPNEPVSPEALEQALAAKNKDAYGSEEEKY